MAASLAVAVVSAFVVLAHHDARTMQVPVGPARRVTVGAVAGFTALGAVTGDWPDLLGAVLGAVLVTGVQLVPFLLQHRAGGEWIGRADVRLAVPFGWTLGWFSVELAAAGLGVALVAGLVSSLASGRRAIPFVPFLTAGLGLGVAWALVGPAGTLVS